MIVYQVNSRLIVFSYILINIDDDNSNRCHRTRFKCTTVVNSDIKRYNVGAEQNKLPTLIYKVKYRTSCILTDCINHIL